jgi:nucleotide-binding universal stress UspA family protein
VDIRILNHEDDGGMKDAPQSGYNWREAADRRVNLRHSSGWRLGDERQAACILITKKVATISGVTFTIIFFIVFELSDIYNRKRKATHEQDQEKFRLDTRSDLSAASLSVRPGSVLVAVRNPHRLQHLQRILEKTDTRKLDIVVLSVRMVTQAGSGEHGLYSSQLFSDDVTNVFTHVVTLAEKAGKHVELMVVPGSDPYEAVVQTAALLQSSRIVMGLSPKLTASEQGSQVGRFWEQLPAPRPALSLEIVLENQKDVTFFNLGPHPPRLWPEDIDLAHRLWLDLAGKGPGARLHHRDIIGVALRRMAADLDSARSSEVVEDITKEVSGGFGHGVET